jgi:hypothetical protein
MMPIKSAVPSAQKQTATINTRNQSDLGTVQDASPESGELGPGKTDFEGSNMISKMMLNRSPSGWRISPREAMPFRPITDAGFLDSTEISGLSAMFHLFILALRDLSKVLVNPHSSPWSPIAFQYAKHSEP